MVSDPTPEEPVAASHPDPDGQVSSPVENAKRAVRRRVREYKAALASRADDVLERVGKAAPFPAQDG